MVKMVSLGISRQPHTVFPQLHLPGVSLKDEWPSCSLPVIVDRDLVCQDFWHTAFSFLKHLF